MRGQGIFCLLHLAPCLPASAPLSSGIDHLGRHVAFIMFGEHRVGCERVPPASSCPPPPRLALPETNPALCPDNARQYRSCRRLRQSVPADCRRVPSYQVSLAPDTYACAWRQGFFGDVSWRIKENNRTAQCTQHQSSRNGEDADTCADQNQSSLLARHSPRSAREPCHIFDTAEFVRIASERPVWRLR